MNKRKANFLRILFLFIAVFLTLALAITLGVFFPNMNKFLVVLICSIFLVVIWLLPIVIFKIPFETKSLKIRQ